MLGVTDESGPRQPGARYPQALPVFKKFSIFGQDLFTSCRDTGAGRLPEGDDLPDAGGSFPIPCWPGGGRPLVSLDTVLAIYPRLDMALLTSDHDPEP